MREPARPGPRPQPRPAPPAGANRPARPRKQRPSRRGRPRWGLRTATGAAALVLLTSGVGHAVVTGLGTGVQRVDPFSGLTDRPEAGVGVNFLIAGVDDRKELSERERKKNRLGGTSCDCTDTLMLVHLSDNGDRVSVVSLPRDSYVKLPAYTDKTTGKRHSARPAKINAAYAYGGPHLTVRAVEKMTDVHIDHYLEIDFSGFMRAVDVLGGVPVCTAQPLTDKYSGLDLPAGTSHLNGGEALSYVRARHLDGASDVSRMQRQQSFLASLLDRVTSSGVLMNPVRLDQVTSSLLDAVRADRGFGADQMLTLGKAVRELTPSSSEFVSVPVKDLDHRVQGLGSTVRWNKQKAAELFGALRDDEPLTATQHDGKGDGKKSAGKRAPGMAVGIAPRNVRVQVENGTGKRGLGHRADRALHATGFNTVAAPRNAERDDVKKTVIHYDPRWDRSVKSLAAALPGAKLKKETGRGPVMRVVLGKDFERVRPVHGGTPRPEPGSEDGKGFGAISGDEVVCPE